jgi:hypothetical protein
MSLISTNIVRTTASTCQILWRGSCEKVTQEQRQAPQARICRSSECYKDPSGRKKINNVKLIVEAADVQL